MPAKTDSRCENSILASFGLQKLKHGKRCPGCGFRSTIFVGRFCKACDDMRRPREAAAFVKPPARNITTEETDPIKPWMIEAAKAEIRAGRGTKGFDRASVPTYVPRTVPDELFDL